METLKIFGTFLLAYLPVILLLVAAGFWIYLLIKSIGRKRHDSKVRKVKVGDKIQTIKGLEGTVVGVDKDTFDLEYGEHCASFVFEAIKNIL